MLTNPVPVENHLSVRETARRLGVKVSTLRTWRCKGRGPLGYKKLSSTHGVYSESSVTAWMTEKGLMGTALPSASGPKGVTEAATTNPEAL